MIYKPAKGPCLTDEQAQRYRGRTMATAQTEPDTRPRITFGGVDITEHVRSVEIHSAERPQGTLLGWVPRWTFWIFPFRLTWRQWLESITRPLWQRGHNDG